MYNWLYNIMLCYDIAMHMLQVYSLCLYFHDILQCVAHVHPASSIILDVVHNNYYVIIYSRALSGISIYCIN